MKTITEILAIEGIVIRKIPVGRTTRYLTTSRYKLKTGERLISDEDGRLRYEVDETFTLGGKYLVGFAYNQDAMVRFSKTHVGIGDTVEQAYADLVQKGTISHEALHC